MKQIISIFFMCLLLASCQQEAEVMQETEQGYLMLTSVKAETEHISQPATRAVDPSFQIEIWQDGGQQALHTYKPGEITPSTKIELKAGKYLIKAYTLNYQMEWQNGEKGEAQYYLEQSFVVNANQVNRLSMSIPMKNTAVTLVLPQEFHNWFQEYTFAIEQGTTRIINLREGETAYINSHTPISYAMTARNHDGEQNIQSNRLQDPVPNTVYEITYSLAIAQLQHLLLP